MSETNDHQNQPIRLRQAENGFHVSIDTDRFCMPREWVFQSLAELGQFLEVHFTHRNQTILTDSAPNE